LIVGNFLAALVLISLGVFFWWEVHSGEPSRTTLVYCPGGKVPTCAALWPPVTTPVEIVEVPNQTWFDEGQTVDVDHDGRTVHVKLIKCHVDNGGIGCTGVAPPPPDSIGLIDVQLADGSDVGKSIAVHLHAGRFGPILTADSPLLPFLPAGMGCVALVIGVVDIVQRRRNPIPPAGWADPTNQGFLPL
jgi:hypothetical protein